MKLYLGIGDVVCGQLLTQQSQVLTTKEKKPFENNVKKEKMLVTNILSFCHFVFYSVGENFVI